MAVNLIFCLFIKNILLINCWLTGRNFYSLQMILWLNYFWFRPVVYSFLGNFTAGVNRGSMVPFSPVFPNIPDKTSQQIPQKERRQSVSVQLCSFSGTVAQLASRKAHKNRDGFQYLVGGDVFRWLLNYIVYYFLALFNVKLIFFTSGRNYLV